MRTAKFYNCAILTKNGTPGNFSNISKVFAHLQALSAGATLYHGRPGMDIYRLKTAMNYGSFLIALQRDNFVRVPFFWIIDGETYLAEITRHYVE